MTMSRRDIRRLAPAFIAACCMVSLCIGAGDGVDMPALKRMVEALRPLHEPITAPGPSDWLANHHEEGQTFSQYVACGPVRPEGKRRTICVQPLGDFTGPQRRIVTLTAEFMSLFYGLPVRVEPQLPLSLIPATARRRPAGGAEQILTSYVLQSVLAPRLPADVAVYIAFTASDLWPGEGWNFVFGQASLRERVGVWSLHRNGDPAPDDAAFRLCLLRTLKTGVHETGHMFSMQHCTMYECGMCGSNHLAESDRRPLWFCPECAAKVCMVARAEPAETYRKLAEFCATNGLAAEAAFYVRSAEALDRSRPAVSTPAEGKKDTQQN